MSDLWNQLREAAAEERTAAGRLTEEIAAAAQKDGGWHAATMPNTTAAPATGPSPRPIVHQQETESPAMTQRLYRAARTYAGPLMEAASMCAALVGGILGAYLGYRLAPLSLSENARILVAGGTAVIGALVIDGHAEIALRSLRRLLYEADSPTPPPGQGAPVPATVHEAMSQLAAAAGGDAARRAAFGAFDLDESDGFLRNSARWHGYLDGTAAFVVAPGLVLHHRARPGTYRDEHEFTLLSGESDHGATITSITELLREVSLRMTGCPAPAPLDPSKDAPSSPA
ncbi:hypothetical protein ACIBUR_29445 [Streptomyces anulatus]